ncbi:hypothetical protein JCM10908_001094 [Rhodotorula pacifica]|uniref:uncharacterized protein n=1 Tax=Rhodotorula pacifica TaxID=1495444 RepID=UPI00317442D4
MAGPQLPIELVRDILELAVRQHKRAYGPTTQLLKLATSSKAWKPIIEELALRHVEIDIGAFQAAHLELCMDEESIPASERKRCQSTSSIELSIYQDEGVVSEWALRALVKCLSIVRPLERLDIRYANLSSTALSRDGVDDASFNGVASLPQTSCLKVNDLNLDYSFRDASESATVGEILLVESIDCGSLESLAFGYTAYLPPLSWWTGCKNLKELTLTYRKHIDVRRTAASLLALLPNMERLRELCIICYEDRDYSDSEPPPSPYPISTFLACLPASIFALYLTHTHFDVPADLPALRITPELEAAFNEKPHAYVSFAYLQGQLVPSTTTTRLVSLIDKNGQEQWTLLLE